MIQKKLLALALGLALFSCQKVSHEVVPEKPQGWEIYSTPKESSLRGLSPVTGDIVWVSGSRGTWMRTLDGGKTWDSGIIAGLDSVDFRSIYGFDAEKAVAVSAGQPAVIYKTLDGGKTWELKHQGSEKAFLDGISFATEDRGYVFGDPEDGRWTILETVDQGESWRLVDSLPQAAEGEAGFAASASSFIAEGDHLYLGSGGKEANLYVSKDRGNSWEKFKSPLQQGESSQGIFALTSTGKGEIIVTGGDYLHENQNEGNLGIFLPADKKWINSETSVFGYRSGIAFFPRFQWVVAVGPNGTDFSKDGGLNWEKISSENEGFHAVKMSQSEGTLWASGAQGKVGKLTF